MEDVRALAARPLGLYLAGYGLPADGTVGTNVPDTTGTSTISSRVEAPTFGVASCAVVGPNCCSGSTSTRTDSPPATQDAGNSALKLCASL